MSTVSRGLIAAYLKGEIKTLTNSEQRELARIALASLEAEPVAWLYSASFERGHVEGELTDAPGCDMPVYTAPPAPVSVPAAYEHTEDFSEYHEGWNACRAAMLQGADGNSPVIAKAYDIEAFGVFSATEGENGLMLQIERFRFGSEKCPQIGKENMVPKFALQGVINRLQKHCDSMGNEALVDILSTPAAQH